MLPVLPNYPPVYTPLTKDNSPERLFTQQTSCTGRTIPDNRPPREIKIR